MVLEQLDVHARRWLPVGFFVMLALATACGDEFEAGEPPPPCNQEPSVCDAGTTCWFKTDLTWDCLTSGAAAPWAPCTAQVDNARAPCGDGHLCLSTDGTVNGICAPFCDPFASQPCANGGDCAQVAFQIAGSPDRTPPINVCLP